MEIKGDLTQKGRSDNFHQFGIFKIGISGDSISSVNIGHYTYSSIKDEIIEDEYDEKVVPIEHIYIYNIEWPLD